MPPMFVIINITIQTFLNSYDRHFYRCNFTNGFENVYKINQVN